MVENAWLTVRKSFHHSGRERRVSVMDEDVFVPILSRRVLALKCIMTVCIEYAHIYVYHGLYCRVFVLLLLLLLCVCVSSSHLRSFRCTISPNNIFNNETPSDTYPLTRPLFNNTVYLCNSTRRPYRHTYIVYSGTQTSLKVS